MRRVNRHKAYREQQLQRAVMAAGASFGCDDGPAMPLRRNRGRATPYYASLLLLAPCMTSALWYFRG